jgi:hypothetical protein
MGVHFTVTVDHDIHDTSLESVRDRFASLQPMFLEISVRSQQKPDSWRDITEPGRPHPDHFYAPAGFSVLIGPAALRFHHSTRFSTFIDSAAERDLMRQFSRQLAQIFGHYRALYAPCEDIGDEIADWLTDGLSLADIESRLRGRSSPPVTIEALAKRSLPELRYYIEEFKDVYVEHEKAG